MRPISLLWRDFTLLLAMVLAILVLYIGENQSEEAEVKAEGNLLVECEWPDGYKQDIDLWVESPNGEKTGYSSRDTTFMSLWRDDLGNTGDTTNINREFVTSRGLEAGEYTVNVHYYSGSGEVPVECSVSHRKGNEGYLRSLGGRTVILKRAGEEQTIARFELDETGDRVPGSLNNIFKPIRTAR